MKQKSSFKISAFFILLCFYMHQVFKYKAYNKVLFDKKKLWHFFSKIELQRQWSCVMCTWQGLFNARGKNFALPPPLTGRNIHSGSKGGVKNNKHKFKFCLILSYFPYFSNWNCLKRIFFNLNIILWLLVRYWKFCFDIHVWYIPLLYGILTTVHSAAAVACCHVHCHHIVKKMEKKKMAKKKRHLAPTRKFARHIHSNRFDY